MPCFSNGSRLTRYRSEPVVVRRGGPALLTFYTSRTWYITSTVCGVDLWKHKSDW
ncbi:hypothetical protein DY000_02035655 [Brassica cretica]|uniref:Uncharacterized protein n=1 Tax=Brassica cretica TaxID=69181 RepID=A0ABQ7DMR3_BRACR|nr:hypothetical protein DY000_02035655 [Brassica cretica]